MCHIHVLTGTARVCLETALSADGIQDDSRREMHTLKSFFQGHWILDEPFNHFASALVFMKGMLQNGPKTL